VCSSTRVSEQFLNGTSAHNRPFQCHAWLETNDKKLCIFSVKFCKHTFTYWFKKIPVSWDVFYLLLTKYCNCYRGIESWQKTQSNLRQKYKIFQLLGHSDQLAVCHWMSAIHQYNFLLVRLASIKVLHTADAVDNTWQNDSQSYNRNIAAFCVTTYSN